MSFNQEKDFEDAFINVLRQHGWGECPVLKYPTEADLLKNWAEILFQNNRAIDKLNDVPLTDSEMAQILEQITTLKTPMRLNEFINGKTVSIRRDNPQDTLNCGKEVSLKIYDRLEIAAGSSRYQIAQQPQFAAQNAIFPKRRGDIMLLINGMPVFHIELKRSGVPVSQAVNQITKYHQSGVFSGIFALVQIFVAANPEESIYFANQPMPDGKFNSNYQFHWGNFDNQPILKWNEVIDNFLNIPMAHEMIGFYSVADHGDGCLKVMRSYQYFAASRISTKVAMHSWKSGEQRGGYIWHTTGSGKTMTSFKSAQLIAEAGNADKVIFLMDRVELGTQSVDEYGNFSGLNDQEQKQKMLATASTSHLLAKLKSNKKPQDTLIVSSIQKMSNIKEEAGYNEADIEAIRQKRLVFILDECHRSVFGGSVEKDNDGMLTTIKKTFPNALFFGFTGTPIHDENQRKNSTTADIFGDELHRYSLADGIRDKNVLGFDVYRVETFKESDIRRKIGLAEANATTVEEVMSDPQKKKVFMAFQQKPMAGFKNDKGRYQKGVEDYLPKEQYRTEAHQKAVVYDIQEQFPILSQGNLFHAIFATSSIPEAIQYYRLFKVLAPELKVTALFDSSDHNDNHSFEKLEGTAEIIGDYNERYGVRFTIPTWEQFKKDIAKRLAHKRPYHVNFPKEKQLDLLIVVDQMLTGFDSKFVNTLYMDKLMKYENIIQAFSRTNRLYDEQYKPFGIVRYYRKPHTMESRIKAAVKLYSGDKAFGLFVNKLPKNILEINRTLADIRDLFALHKIVNFEKLPADKGACLKFVEQFNVLCQLIDSAKIQGMTWEIAQYQGEDDQVVRELDKATFDTLLQRYKELSTGSAGGNGGYDDVPFDLNPHITSRDTGKIDSDYMNNNFEKFLKLNRAEISEEDDQQLKQELHKSFATLTQEEQYFAKLILQQVENGDFEPMSNKTMRDYITDYVVAAQNKAIQEFAEHLGLDKTLFKALLDAKPTEQNINEYGRFDKLLESTDNDKAKAHFEKLDGKSIPAYKVKIRLSETVRAFILTN